MASPHPRSKSRPVDHVKDGHSGDEHTQATDVINLTHDTDDDDDEISKTVEIDPRGDLKLIVGNKKVCFLVCSRALSRSASIWKSMLNGPFAEAKPTNGRDWVVKLPEDHADAFEVLLNLVHWPGQPEMLPEVNLQLAFEVTVLTNKYFMTHCLVQCAQGWITKFAYDLKNKSEEEDMFWTPPLEWLWIARELGDLMEYQNGFKQVAFRCHYFQNGPILHRFYQQNLDMPGILRDRPLSTAGAAVLCPLVEDLLLARETAIQKIKSPARKDMGDLKEATRRNYPSSTEPNAQPLATPPLCKASDATYMEKCQCDLTMLGSAVSYENHKEWPLNGEAKDEILSIQCYHELATYTAGQCVKKAVKVLGKRHKRCTVFKSGFPTLAELEQLVGEIATSNGTLKYIHRQGLLSGHRREVMNQPFRKRSHTQITEDEPDEPNDW